MLDSPVLGQCEELAGIFGALPLRENLVGIEVYVACNGEITVMHLVDNKVGRRLQGRAYIILPARRVCLRHVYDSTVASVHAHGLSEYAHREAAVDVEMIGLVFYIAFHGCRPNTVSGVFHLHFLFSLTVLIKYIHFLGIGRGKEFERRCAWCVCYFVKIEVLSVGSCRTHC